MLYLKRQKISAYWLFVGDLSYTLNRTNDEVNWLAANVWVESRSIKPTYKELEAKLKNELQRDGVARRYRAEITREMMKDILTFLCDCGPRKFEIRGKFHYLTNLYNKIVILFLKLSEDIF